MVVDDVGDRLEGDTRDRRDVVQRRGTLPGHPARCLPHLAETTTLHATPRSPRAVHLPGARDRARGAVGQAMGAGSASATSRPGQGEPTLVLCHFGWADRAAVTAPA